MQWNNLGQAVADVTFPPAALLMQSLLDGVGNDRTAIPAHKADSFQLNYIQSCKLQETNMQLVPKIILAVDAAMHRFQKLYKQITFKPVARATMSMFPPPS